MEQSDIPVFIGIGNDNQPVTTKITSINFARLLIFHGREQKNIERSPTDGLLCSREFFGKTLTKQNPNATFAPENL